MKEKILQTLRDLRAYALTKSGLTFEFFYHEEDSYLMRFANSAISLNTNEHLIRLEITAHVDRKRVNYAMITDLGKLDEMKQGVDTAAAMVVHAQALNYEPTIPLFSEDFIDESSYDPDLAIISNEERLAFFNQAVAGLETEQVRLSGIFSNGTNTLAQINTRSEHTQFFCSTDAQATIVLAHASDKWEVSAEQSSHSKAGLDPDSLHRDLAYLLEQYRTRGHAQLPLGRYDIVFGAAAIADLLNVMNWVGFSGGAMKRGYSFLKEEQTGQQVFSNQFNLIDDPDNLDTFPLKRDLTGIPRKRWPLIDAGKFTGFVWYQDDADEFGAKATGHTVTHKSMVVEPGSQNVATLEELVNQPRDKDLLYIPFLPYMNLVNPSMGVITASSRFGALLLKADGSVVVPFNVRLTQSLLDIFGEKIAWLSSTTLPYNTSTSYGARNPTATTRR